MTLVRWIVKFGPGLDLVELASFPTQQKAKACASKLRGLFTVNGRKVRAFIHKKGVKLCPSSKAAKTTP